MATRYLDNDIARFYVPDPAGKKKKVLVATMFWGDKVTVLDTGKIEVTKRVWDVQKKRYVSQKWICDRPKGLRFRDEPLLKVRFIDVGQGDGAMIETPDGQIVLIDGGEEEHMRRYINVAFAHVLKTRPLHCAAIVVTHGDADHFDGLTKLAMASRSKDSPMVTADNVFHNGLVKRPSPRSSNAKVAFGPSREHDGSWYATGLVDHPEDVKSSDRNKPFNEWVEALGRLKKANKSMKVKRVAYGDDPFAFMNDENLRIEVLGPFTRQVAGKDALRLLKTPGGSSLSASHTINGHSIVLRLHYGNVRVLFGADLNEESQEDLLKHATAEGFSLTSEVLKVPHHGSADFSPRVLEAIKPVVSVVSSGDENAAKEYIHPRAGLVGALGKYSRAGVDKPLVYVTEMVAFMARLGTIQALAKKKNDPPAEIVNAYQKKAFGIVHIRTDGERVVVVTHSGKDDQKESYAFRVDAVGQITFEEKTNIV